MAEIGRAGHTATLPHRNGVSASFVALPAVCSGTLLAFLSQRFPAIAAATWVARMERGEVLDERGSVMAPDTPCRPHAKIYYYRELEAETRIPFEETILHIDAHLLVADKPHFLPVTPSGRFLQETLLVRLRQKTGLADLTPIHRLDRETAGVMLFSHNLATRGLYQSLFLSEPSQAQALRLITRHRVSLTNFLPAAYEAKIRAIPGVKDVTSWTWFGGVYKDNRDPNNFFARFAVEQE